MKVVYKYPIPIQDITTLRLPEGCTILHIGEQHRDLWLWALIDDKETETSALTLRIAGTGHPLGDPETFGFAPGTTFHFLETVVMNGGALAFHVFQVVMP